MANMNNVNDKSGLRRYSINEYQMADLFEDSNKVNHLSRNKMTNLEVLSTRGFSYDEDRDIYTDGQIELTSLILEEKDIWKDVDDMKKNSNESEVRSHVKMENIRKLKLKGFKYNKRQDVYTNNIIMITSSILDEKIF